HADAAGGRDRRGQRDCGGDAGQWREHVCHHEVFELWRGCLHDIEDAADHYKLGAVRTLSETEERTVYRLSVCQGKLHALCGDWSAAGEHRLDRARHAERDGQPDPRVYLADARAAEPEYRAGA